MHPSSAHNMQPVVLLVFANDRSDRERYLRNLGKECEQLEELLRPLEESGLIELDVLHNATAETLAARLGEYDGRTALLHYGGHATSLALLLEDESGQPVDVSAEDLAALLGLQKELKLVFLNGCLTDGHIELLLEAGIAAVIGTTAAVPDDTALAFAREFYSQLARGYPIERAYQAAAAVTRLGGNIPAGGYHVTVDGQIIRDGPLAAPWVIEYRPGAEEVANWNIPAAAGDYLFNLPPLPQRSLSNNPYHEVLAWYGAAEAEIFFGRGRQIRDLFLRLTASDGSPVVLLCGQSGVGKSSLLEAGLLPRLEQIHAVCYRRRRRELGAAGALREALGAQANADGQALAARWLLEEETQGRPLTILLDQVEEIFTRPLLQQPDELIELAQTAEEVFRAGHPQPQGKLLLSFRKEYLPEIEAALRQRHVNSSYVFLSRLDAAGIAEVINGPASSSRLQDKYNLSIEDGLPEQIAANLTADAASPIATLLQILLAEMWKAARQAQPTAPRFDRELYYRLQRTSIHLNEFLAGRRAEYARKLPQAEESGLLLDILYFCTNEQGTAEQHSVQEFEQRYGSDRNLPGILQTAKELRLLVDAAGEAQAHSAAGGARLAHDTLAPVVREAFHRSTLPGQRAERVLLAHADNWTAGQQPPPAVQKAILDEVDLNTVEKGLAGMRRPGAAEDALIAASRIERAAARRRRRLSRMTIATVAVIILALAAATGWFGWSAQESAAAAQVQEAAARSSAAQSAAQLTLSQSREVAAVAENQLRNGDPQTALLLSLQAFTQITKTAQAEAVLRQSLSQWQGLYTLAGHTNAVNGLFFSQDGRYLASASIDSTARVWDLATGQPLLTIAAHAGEVSAALVSGDGRRLITSSRDGSTRIWELPSGELQHEIIIPGIADGIRSLSLHSNGQWVGLRAGNQIWLYDAATGQPVASSPYVVPGDQPVALRSLAFTADGNQLLAGGDDTLPHIWDIASGAHAALAPPEGAAGHQSAVLNFQQTRDEHFFVAVSADRVALWERALDTGGVAWRALPDSSGGVRFSGQALFSPDSRFLVAATTSGSLRIWSLADLTAAPAQVNEYTTAVSGIWLSPDGRLLASAGADGSLHMYDMVSRTSTSIAQMAGSTSAPVFSRDGSMLAAADATGTIHVWRTWLGGDRPALRLHSFAANAVALAGTQVVIAGSGGAVEFRNLADAGVRIQKIGNAYYTAAAASADGKLAAVADTTGLVAVLDVQSGRLLNYWRAEQQRIDDLQFLADSDQLAVAGAMPAVHVWNWRSGEMVAALSGPTNDITSLAYAPLSNRLYAAGRDGLVHAWQLPEMMPLPARTAGTPARTAGMSLVALAVSPDESQIVAAAANGPLFWWPDASAASPRVLAVRSPVRSLAYTAAGRLLAGTENGELQLWNLATRSVVAVDAHQGRWVKGIAIDNAGARAITIGDDGWLKQWLLEDEELVHLACARAGRTLTTSEWDQYFDFGTSLDFAPCAGAPAAQDAAGAAGRLTALTFSEPITTPTDYRPTVLYFESVQGSHVPLNSEIILRWSVVGGTQQDLEYQGFDIALRGQDELRVRIVEATTFRLIARNPYGVQILSLTVTPDG